MSVSYKQLVGRTPPGLGQQRECIHLSEFLRSTRPAPNFPEMKMQGFSLLADDYAGQSGPRGFRVQVKPHCCPLLLRRTWKGRRQLGSPWKRKERPCFPSSPPPTLSALALSPGWFLLLSPWWVCLPALFACPLACPFTQLVLDSDLLLSCLRKSTVVLAVKNPPANAGDRRDTGSIPGLGRSPGEVIGNPL